MAKMGLPGSSPARNAKRNLDLQRLQNFTQENNPDLRYQPFTEIETALLKDLYALGRDDAALVSLLVNFHNPEQSPTALQERLRSEYALLTSCKKNRVPLDKWIAIPGWEDLQENWNRLSPVWTAEVSRGPLKTETTAAQIDPEKHKIWFRQIPSGQPLPLTAAEEVIHVQQLETVLPNHDKIQSWVKDRFIKIQNPELQTIPLLNRDWKYNWTTQILKNKIPDSNARHVIEFLLERDAMVQKLELYKKLIQSHPQYHSRDYEEIVRSSDPLKKINALLNERFHLSPEMLAQLRRFSIDDIVRMEGGKPLKFIRYEAAKVTTSTPFKLDGRQLLAITPPVLQRPPFYGDPLSRYAASLPDSELQGLIQYLRSPDFSAAPYAFGNYVAAGKYRPVGAEEQKRFSQAVKVYDNFGHAILLLQEYDRLHQTHHALEESTRLLRNLRPSSETGNNKNLVGYICQAIQESDHPETAQRFIEALTDSPLLFGILERNHGVWNTVYKLLSRVYSPLPVGAKQGKLYPPPTAKLEEFYDDFIAYHQGVGQTAREKQAKGWHLDYARQMATNAEAYFKKLGDRERSEKYQERLAKLQSVRAILLDE
jgi:hypothetical protein